jgi:diguanylate cyclase (GGDEF)-like protein
VIARDLAARRQTGEASGVQRLLGGGPAVDADLPAIADRRVKLAESISALGLFFALIAALTAGTVIGAGYAYSDLVVLLGVQLASAVAIWRIPWRAASEAWLLAVIGLQVLFVASLITLTGGSASPYYALYAPILALAGWHLRAAPLALSVGLVAVTELWRALIIDPTADIRPLAVAMPIFILLAVLAWLTSQRSTISLVRNRRDQVRTSATLEAIRSLAERNVDDPADGSALLAGAALDADAWLVASAEIPSAAEHTCASPASEHLSLPVPALGAKFGLLNLCRAQPFSTSELRLAGILADAIGQTLENRRLFEEVRGESMRDHLTGLLNRRAFDAEVERLAAETGRGEGSLSLFFLDIDGFKALNDKLGHDQGDRILQRISRALLAQARASDHIYRYGGDEFVMLAPDVDAEAALAMAERLRMAVASHGPARSSDLRTEAAYFDVAVSVGVATCQGSSCAAHSLVSEADRAMYGEKLAKTSGSVRD